MALINRISRLFRADFNAVLDQIEEPEQLVRQAIREMEDDISATEQGIAQLARQQKSLVQRREDIESSIGEQDRQLDLCFESGNDNLARSLIKRKLESERLLKQLTSRLDSVDQRLDEQRKRLDDNRLALDGLRQKAELFVTSGAANDMAEDIDHSSWGAQPMAVSDDDVEIAFLHEKSSRCAS
jgi:phage shock protein A